MFWQTSIRSRVMAVVEEKIQEAQNAYDAEQEELLDQFEKALDDLHAKMKSEKEGLIEKHVQSIIKKIL